MTALESQYPINIYVYLLHELTFKNICRSYDLIIICMVPCLTILHDNYSTDSKIWSTLVN